MTARHRQVFTGRNMTGERQFNVQPKIVRRHLRVARVEEITPKYRRIVLTGEALRDFPYAHFSIDHVKGNFPDPVTGKYRGYREIADDEWEEEEGRSEMIFRDYTPRAFDPKELELTLDFFIHDHGIAGVWAREAKPGDALAVNGPSTNQLYPENYGHYLAGGDETALPAIARLIEEAPAGSHITAIIEIADASEEQDIAAKAGAAVDLCWVHRDTAEVAEGCSSALETALRRTPLPDDLSDLFVFVAGETGTLKPIRRWLRRELELPKHQVIIDGYWKRGVADHDHHTDDED